MGKNLQALKDAGAVDPDAADALRAEVVAKIEAFSEEEIKTIIKFKKQISGNTPWEPEDDGSIL